MSVYDPPFGNKVLERDELELGERVSRQLFWENNIALVEGYPLIPDPIWIDNWLWELYGYGGPEDPTLSILEHFEAVYVIGKTNG